MSKPNMKCRVCGKEYFCCADSKSVGSWRTMACSEEHYKEYIRRIEESRKPKVVETVIEGTEIIEETDSIEVTAEEEIKVEKPKKIKSKYSTKNVDDKND